MGFGGFSWKRASGISRAKGNISRAIGVPLTKSGRQRKLGAALGGNVLGAFVGTSTRATQSSLNTEEASAGDMAIGCGIFIALGMIGYVWFSYGGTAAVVALVLACVLGYGIWSAVAGKCQNCGNKAILSEIETCKECSATVLEVAHNVLKVVQKSGHLVETSKILKTRLQHCENIIESAESLLAYENKGIDVISPSPSKLIANMQEKRSQIVLGDLTQAFHKAEAASQTASTLRGKVGPTEKFLAKLSENEELVSNRTDVASLRSQAASIVHYATLSDYLDKAKKAEFKGKSKKALEHYYEALYYIRNDDVDDALQGKLIGKLEKRILKLGGSIPASS